MNYYEEIKKQVSEREGCQLKGFFKVNKVPGNFHISSHAFGPTISRLAGDEFVIVAPGLALHKLDDVKMRLEKCSVDVKNELGLPFDISISIGGVLYSDKNCDLEKLIKAADVEQYKEKEIHHARMK